MPCKGPKVANRCTDKLQGVLDPREQQGTLHVLGYLKRREDWVCRDGGTGNVTQATNNFDVSWQRPAVFQKGHLVPLTCHFKRRKFPVYIDVNYVASTR